MERRSPKEFRELSEMHKRQITYKAEAAWRTDEFQWLYNMIHGGSNLSPRELSQRLRDAQHKLNEAKGALSEHRDHMRGADKHEVWLLIQSQQEKINEAWGEVRQMYQRRNLERIGRLEGVLQRKRDALGRRESHMSDLQEKLHSAWSDSYRDRVYGWMQEAQAQIDSLRSDIADIEMKLSDARGRL